jgi:hypothetical protein
VNLTGRRCWCAAIALCALATPAAAQETRAAIIEAAQSEKLAQTRPYTPNKAERIAADVQKRLFGTPEGLYPWFDSVYSGGGFTLGAGYRTFYGDRTFLDVRGLFSAKAYKLFEVATDSLGHARGRIDYHASGGWRDATDVAYHGLAGDDVPDVESNFQLKQTYAGVSVRVHGVAATIADAGLRYEDYSLDPGHGDSPSIEQVHTTATAPGLGANPKYLRTTLTGGIDSRPAAGYARRGGLYAVTYDNFADVDDTYSFDLLQAEVVQHVPVLRENWVLSFHGVAKTTIDDDDTVPYFLLPSLGSGSTLRAYSSWRFRDRHSMLMQGEWRWMPSHLLLDAAIFYDAGKVTDRREDLNFDHLHHDWGFGVRFHGPMATPLRLEYARGSDGFNIVISGAAAF